MAYMEIFGNAQHMHIQSNNDSMMARHSVHTFSQSSKIFSDNDNLVPRYEESQIFFENIFKKHFYLVFHQKQIAVRSNLHYHQRSFGFIQQIDSSRHHRKVLKLKMTPNTPSPHQQRP
jgi:hypothetical protein